MFAELEPLLAQVSAAASAATAPALLGTALLLGIRHGVDWDHIAAISDIASTTASEDLSAGRRGATAHGHGQAAAHVHATPTFGQMERRALGLSLLYALGHASVVLLLGVAALSFSALLPDWIDPIMERVVGVTLVVLGVWVFYALFRSLRGGGEFRLRSRWMLVFAGVRHAFNRGRRTLRGGGAAPADHFHVDQYGPRSAFGVGMLHGIGAETGSQALLIAAVGGATEQGLGAGMLLFFVVGLVISNTIIALLASTGFISSARARPFYLALGALTGVFSLAVGLLFVVGAGVALPDLSALLGFLGGESGS